MNCALIFCFTLCFSLISADSADTFIDNLISQSKDAAGEPHADKATIINLDTGLKGISDAHPNALNITSQEAETIANCFKTGDFSPLMENGVTIDGTKYKCLIEVHGNLVLARKKDHGAITMQSSKTAIVIAHTIEGRQQGQVNDAVQSIVDYFETVGM